MLFLSPAYAPRQFFSGWLDLLARLNPVTYVLEGMRELVSWGWNAEAILYAVGAILVFATISWEAAFASLDGRTR